MSTSTASYRTRQSTPPASPVDPGQLLKLSEDLAQLVAEGLVVPYCDENNVVRYRPIQKECEVQAA